MGFFITLASGSTGNCALYHSGADTVLIDAGTSTRDIKNALRDFGLALSDLSGILLTHSHSDHTRALPVLLKHTDCPVLCTAQTAVDARLPLDRVRVIDIGTHILGHMEVTAFPTHHDVPGSLGFVLGVGAGRLGYCTDTGHLPAEELQLLLGCPTVVLESNHDWDMLWNGPYPWPLKQRVGSPYGHLSNDQCARAAVALAQTGTSRLILAHLSQHNNSPRAALRATLSALEAAGLSMEVIAAPVGRGEPITWEDCVCEASN